MATKASIEDLNFAQLYVDHLSRKGDPETRARARILLATMAMLDAKHPNWRAELLAELDKRNMSPDIEKMFPLPSVDPDKMFAEFMTTVLRS